MGEMSQKGYSAGYNKRPLWQWIILYVVIGLIVYGLVYYFVFAKKAYSPSSSTSGSQQSATVPTDNIYTTKTDSAKGTHLADFQGRALYTYEKDTSGVSNCTGSCLSAWPPYTSGATAQSNFPQKY